MRILHRLIRPGDPIIAPSRIDLRVIGLFVNRNMILIKIIKLDRYRSLFYVKIVIMSAYIKLGMDTRVAEWLYWQPSRLKRKLVRLKR